MHPQNKTGRLQAASTCRDRHWYEGDWLRSSTWLHDRRIVHIGKHTQRVTFKDAAGNGYDSETFPPDVYVLSSTAEHR